MSLNLLLTAALLSLGTAYIVCGSRVGYWPRVILSLALRFVHLSKLDALFRCPPCHAFWAGAAWAYFLFQASLLETILAAIASCGLVAVLHLLIGGAGLGDDTDLDAKYQAFKVELHARKAGPTPEKKHEGFTMRSN